MPVNTRNRILRRIRVPPKPRIVIKKRLVLEDIPALQPIHQNMIIPLPRAILMVLVNRAPVIVCLLPRLRVMVLDRRTLPYSLNGLRIPAGPRVRGLHLLDAQEAVVVFVAEVEDLFLVGATPAD